MKTAPLFVLSFFLCVVAQAEHHAKHLFILSGQSNMQGHRPDEAFTPAVEKALGKDKVIVIQDALGGQPIHRWWKGWRYPDGDPAGTTPSSLGDLYDRLMGKVKPAVKGQELASVSFVWMQGERDAMMGWGDLYEEALVGLHFQLAKDLGKNPKDMTFVIGRLSDFDMSDKKYPHWTKVRQAQVKVADSSQKFTWVDTDDLNDGKNRRGEEIKNDLHYSAEGYKTLGKRFAEACLKALGK
ncbi:MAG: acetyl xylan esterase [Opitutae bacterium]|nr:acetyl xylan esterase [Opitutae bacterium]